MSNKRRLITLTIAILCIPLFAGTRIIVRADNGVEPVKIIVVMNEYNFIVDGAKPGDPIELKANQLYDMTLINKGNFVHEIWWGKDILTQEGRLDGYATGLFDDVLVAITGTQGTSNDPFEVDAKGLTEIALKAGQSLTVEFTLPDKAKGEWEIGCFQPMPKPTPQQLPMGLMFLMSRTIWLG